MVLVTDRCPWPSPSFAGTRNRDAIEGPPVNMIQSLMLVLLGFSACGFITLLLAPAYWSRAVRLTRARMQDTLPVSEAEFRADRDRLRAQYAIRVHQLQSQVEQAKLSAARQLIDLNRRDARISALESQAVTLEANLEEQQNARRVLEQTVADRVPRIERRLVEARQLIQSRDRDIDSLSQAAQKQKLAFDEASAINNQRREEVDRLNRTLMAHRTRNRDSMRDGAYETELALRSEIAALTSQTEQQASMLEALRERAARQAFGDDDQSDPAFNSADMDQLKSSLHEAEEQLRDARQSSESSQETATGKISELTAQIDEQAAEINRLKASLVTFEEDDPTTGNRLSIRESRIALKARINSMQVNSDQQDRAIKKLRAELLAANERAARQSAYFVSEMRRLGAGTLPTTPPPALPSDSTGRGSQAARVGEPRTASPLARSRNGSGNAQRQSASLAERASQADTVGQSDSKTSTRDGTAPGSLDGKSAGDSRAADALKTPQSEAAGQPETEDKTSRPRRTKLLDRISSIGRS